MVNREVMVEQLRAWAKAIETCWQSGDLYAGLPGVIAGCRAVADDLERATAPERIIVSVSGGLVQGVLGVPAGVVVEVRDYDNAEGLSEDELEALPQDEEGLEYVAAQWTADEAAAWANPESAGEG